MKSLSLTRCPVDCLNWHPRFVSVDFIRMQNDRSKPLYLLFDWTDIDDDTESLICVQRFIIKSKTRSFTVRIHCAMCRSIVRRRRRRHSLRMSRQTQPQLLRHFSMVALMDIIKYTAASHFNLKTDLFAERMNNKLRTCQHS